MLRLLDLILGPPIEPTSPPARDGGRWRPAALAQRADAGLPPALTPPRAFAVDCGRPTKPAQTVQPAGLLDRLPGALRGALGQLTEPQQRRYR